ncbi:MAG: hypothetical protein L0177_19825 [Chloroflexi bacterium]|nr:hypothetical protein [Chloroflexota bacterium]
MAEKATQEELCEHKSAGYTLCCYDGRHDVIRRLIAMARGEEAASAYIEDLRREEIEREEQTRQMWLRAIREDMESWTPEMRAWREQLAADLGIDLYGDQ